MATTNRQSSVPPRRNLWLANQPLQRKMMLAVGLLLILFLTANIIIMSSLRQQETNRQWSIHTYQVLLQIDNVLRAAQTRQVAARGFLLAPSASELERFTESGHELERRISDLRKLVSDNPLQQARLDTIETLAARLQSEVLDSGIRPMQQLDPADPATGAERLRLQANYIQHRTVRVRDLEATLNQMAAEEDRLLAERNQALDQNLDRVKIINAVAIVLGILLALAVIRLTTQLVVRPLRRLTDKMTRLANHDHDFDIHRLNRLDEVGEIARALQVFKQMSLDSEAQSWVRSTVSDISRVLLQATTHREFAQWLINELVPLCGAGIGLFYAFDDASQRLDLLGSYGLRLSNRSAEHYMPGEGLVGQCAVDHKPVFLEDVPTDYLRIDSGSLDALPRHIAILPVLYRDTLIGVLELASLAPLTSLQRKLLDELLPLVALTLENLNQAVHTQGLLAQTKEQADELRVSELVMRQQKEVLRERNETLQTKTTELEEQSRKLIASEDELREQAEELRSSNEELREMTDSLNRQRYVLEDLQQETADKAAELARASQYKSEFLANMSHELRTPLNSLLILSRSLAENETGNLDEEQIESARIIHDAGNSLLHLINDILDLSKVEAGKMELVIADLTIADLGKRLQRTFAHVAVDKKLDFSVSIDPGLPAVLATDSGKLEQIANNLLSNAFKFTARGSVTVHIGRPPDDLELPAELSGRRVLALTVADTGIGIPEDKLGRIFSAFEQADASTSRQFGGTGLGLALSRRMAQLLGGDVVLQSEPGRGSRFTLLLPEAPPSQGPRVARLEHDASESARPQPSPHLVELPIPDDRDSLRAGQVTILVIEDDPAFVRILLDMIHRRGYRALAAMDGESGLQLARSHRPGGILLDIGLPVMDGWTVLDRLKADDATRSIPVHLISVSDDSRHSIERGAVGFLTKPVSRESIAAALDRLLSLDEGTQRHVLVVDDDADSRKAVRFALKADHVGIDEAESAEAALPKIAAMDYDCIVLDLGLPGLSGLELLQQLGSTPNATPPVVVYSGRDLSEQERRELQRDAEAIVAKGARSTGQLLEEVGRFLRDIHAPATVEPSRPSIEALAGHRVLLVDDDMRNLFALSKVLRGWGMHVSMAQDGPKALGALETEPAPDVVLMDIMMPGMDGYATIQAIREKPRFATLPIIAITAKAMAGDREVCLDKGANDYLSKPIDIDKLAATIQGWLAPMA